MIYFGGRVYFQLALEWESYHLNPPPNSGIILAFNFVLHNFWIFCVHRDEPACWVIIRGYSELQKSQKNHIEKSCQPKPPPNSGVILTFNFCTIYFWISCVHRDEPACWVSIRGYSELQKSDKSHWKKLSPNLPPILWTFSLWTLVFKVVTLTLHIFW